MKQQTALALAAVALMSVASSRVMAEDAPPTYKGDPGVYKLIFEDQNFRVIEAIRNKGVHDKLHSHPSPSVLYFLTDCLDQLYDGSGKPVGKPTLAKAGTVRAVPVVHAHSAENVGQNDCHQIFVERK
jgi:hypothetical protein